MSNSEILSQSQLVKKEESEKLDFFGITNIVFYNYTTSCNICLENVTLVGDSTTPIAPIFKNLVDWIFQGKVKKRYTYLLSFAKNTKFYTLINEETDSGDYELVWLCIEKLQDISELAERGEKLIKVFVDNSYCTPLTAWYAAQEVILKNAFLIANNKQANENEANNITYGLSGSSIAIYPFRQPKQLFEKINDRGLHENGENADNIVSKYLENHFPNNFSIVKDFVCVDNHIDTTKISTKDKFGIVNKAKCFNFSKITAEEFGLINPKMNSMHPSIKELVTNGSLFLNGSLLATFEAKNTLKELITFAAPEVVNNNNLNNNNINDNKEEEGEEEEEYFDDTLDYNDSIIGNVNDDRIKHYGICFDCDMAEFDILLTNARRVVELFDIIIIINKGWFAVAEDGHYYPYPGNGAWLAQMDINLTTSSQSFDDIAGCL